MVTRHHRQIHVSRLAVRGGGEREEKGEEEERGRKKERRRRNQWLSSSPVLRHKYLSLLLFPHTICFSPSLSLPLSLSSPPLLLLSWCVSLTLPTPRECVWKHMGLQRSFRLYKKGERRELISCHFSPSILRVKTYTWESVKIELAHR